MPCRPKQPTGRALFVLPGRNPGLLVDGNINLFRRPHVFEGYETYNGKRYPVFSSVRSVSFSTDEGETLIPTVIPWRGKWIIDKSRSASKAYDYYKRTKQQLGIFDSIAHANLYSDRLHRQQERIYAGC